MRIGGWIGLGAIAGVVLAGCQSSPQNQQGQGGSAQAGYPYVSPVGWSTQVRCDGMDELKQRVEELEKTMNGIAMMPAEQKQKSPEESEQPGVGGAGKAGEEDASLDKKLDDLSKQVDALEQKLRKKK